MSKRLLVLAVVVVLALGACTPRGSAQSANVTPGDVYAAGPTVSEVQALLGGDSPWWPGIPTFGVRPLDSATIPLQIRFSVTQRFVRLGTPDSFVADYTVYDTVSSATSHMTAAQTALGTSLNGAKAGDQVLYYGLQLSSGAFEFLDIVRVGQIVIGADWLRTEAHPGVGAMSNIAIKLAGKLKNALSGKLRSSPVAAGDSALLLPAGPDVTLLGAARMPIEAVGQLLDLPAPQPVVSAFANLGVSAFVFGDYALDADTRMEVRASVFNFTTRQDATNWLNQFAGTSSLDANGVASGYLDTTKFYYAFFAAGTHGAIFICRSTADQEAAARSCELPMQRVVPAWKLTLAAA